MIADLPNCRLRFVAILFWGLWNVFATYGVDPKYGVESCDCWDTRGCSFIVTSQRIGNRDANTKASCYRTLPLANDANTPQKQRPAKTTKAILVLFNKSE
jgi:hypothetical protein